ncbi:phosphatase PAP2 family protein [Cohnella silvisoli]|uniref:Phosphatase PAP2 family protein n=1 Tax=Cohnella silvisoli TaxID=2873699 RepID=A0ABV1L0U4_9BACL|nr:phosphatase PAP2 family protein [Cohnella silvisoli]MCD9024770.1 phosphatase PAP2 family protein [Cohnella silvisoli]
MINQYMEWLHGHEKRMFIWCNHTIRHTSLDRIFGLLTHIGGATFTILFTLSMALFAPSAWGTAGWQSMAALTASHIIAAIIKKKIQRPRPYLVLPQTKVGRNPLKDHSFPSGHTTAIFSIITPFLFVSHSLTFILIPLALNVGLSRIYMGLHYPSDCIAGCLLGTFSALFMVGLIH